MHGDVTREHAGRRSILRINGCAGVPHERVDVSKVYIVFCVKYTFDFKEVGDIHLEFGDQRFDLVPCEIVVFDVERVEPEACVELPVHFVGGGGLGDASGIEPKGGIKTIAYFAFDDVVIREECLSL